MTVKELVLALVHARDDARVSAGDASNYKTIIGVEIDADGDAILVIEGDGIVTNLKGDDQPGESEDGEM